MKANYHTHTMRCRHALGTDEEYVLAAIRGGYEELGFSDHSCWKYRSPFEPRIRMRLEQFDDYYESIAALREKYRDYIRIKIGLECEYFPKYMSWLKNFVKEKELDYIILGNHFEGSDENGLYYGSACTDDLILRLYVDDCIAGMSTGLYSYLAHPDLFLRGRQCFDDTARKESARLLQWCKDNDVLIEYNLEGMRMCAERKTQGYPRPAFWELAAEIGNTAIIGVDAHRPASLEDGTYYEKAEEYLQELGIRVTDRLPDRSRKTI